MTVFGAIGYCVAAALYLILTVLLFTAWRGRRIAIWLMLATTFSIFWALLLALQAYLGAVNPLVLAFAEIARATLWIGFLVRLLAELGVDRIIRALALAVCAAVAGALAYFARRGSGSLLIPVDLSPVLVSGGLILSLLALILIEQLYRNASVDTKWMLKPLVLGIGGIFAYDLFLYSQGMLFKGLDISTWMARGAVNALFVPLIAVACRRNADWRIRIFVSRQVVFYSTTLFAVGLYLLLMSLGGYLIVRFGGSWGGLARIVFLAGAGLVLLALLFSSVLRARIKVFLNKHFFHNKYDYRDEWLRLVDTLGGFNNESGRSVAIRALAEVVNSPSGAMWIRDDEGSGFRLTARYGTDDDFPDIDADDPLVNFIEERHWLIDFREYKDDPERYGNLKIPGWLETRKAAWLMVPLQTDGQMLGLILLYCAPGPLRLNYEDRDLLKTVGNHVAVHVAQARADRMLAEGRQFEAYNRLTAFLMHDLNNLIAQQSLIVRNAEKHKRNPDFVDDAISTIAGSVERMNRIMQTLKSGESLNQTKLMPLKFIASAAVDRCSANRPVPVLELNGVDSNVDVNAEEFTMVLAHIIRNAQDACREDGSVRVSLHTDADMVTVEVADTGMGMSREFVREQLFRPFHSTKGTRGMGIGAYQAREFARKHGGKLVVDSEKDVGTRVRLSLPAVRSDQAA